MNALQYDELVVYNSVYKYIDSNMFVIVEQSKALVIDPHVDAELQLLFSKNNVHHVTILLTHEHADHISGIWWFLENFKCTLICSDGCAKTISNPRAVRPLLLSFVIEENDRKNGTNILSEFKKDFVVRTYNADLTYLNVFRYSWLNHVLLFKAIQGHSVGSCIILLDEKYAFTGDSLLKDYPIIVSFPHGNRNAFLNETLPFMEKKLTLDTIIFPGHGKPFFLSEIMSAGKICVEFR